MIVIPNAHGRQWRLKTPPIDPPNSRDESRRPPRHDARQKASAGWNSARKRYAKPSASTAQASCVRQKLSITKCSAPCRKTRTRCTSLGVLRHQAGTHRRRCQSRAARARTGAGVRRRVEQPWAISTRNRRIWTRPKRPTDARSRWTSVMPPLGTTSASCCARADRRRRRWRPCAAPSTSPPHLPMPISISATRCANAAALRNNRGLPGSAFAESRPHACPLSAWLRALCDRRT